MTLSNRLKTGLRTAIPVLALLALAACSGDAPLPLGPDDAASVTSSEQTGSVAFTTTKDDEPTFELCKEWSGEDPPVEQAWTFTVEKHGSTDSQELRFKGFECVTVKPFDRKATVTITEIVPDGFESEDIQVEFRTDKATAQIEVEEQAVTFTVGDVKRVSFKNRRIVENGGGEGCTPGFWRQPHHYGFWTEYAPGDHWNEVFDLPEAMGAMVAMNNGRGNGPPANPGNSRGQGNNNGAGAGGNGNGNSGGNQPRSTRGELTAATTLGEAVQLQGGGLNALARHAVAALLNAASPDVDYDLTVREIIDLVNAAITTGNYEDAKNTLEAFNEQGCDVK